MRKGTVDFPDITAARPISSSDAQLIKDLTAVLRRHNALQRFGLTLLHQHFKVHGNEILSEVVDVRKRTLTTRPVEKTTLRSANYKETAWRLDTGKPVAACQICRWSSERGKHVRDC
jgi:hypothetical protein